MGLGTRRWIAVFLRLFSAYRQLEAELKAARSVRDGWKEKAEEAESRVASLTAMVPEMDALQEANRELITENAVLQDQVRAAADDKDHLWGMIQESMASERNALRMQVNHAVQKAGGGIPYPDAHSLPQSAVPQARETGPAGRRRRMLPSEILASRNREFVREFVTANAPDTTSHG